MCGLRLTDLLNWAIYSWEDVGIFIKLCFNPMHFGKLLGQFHRYSGNCAKLPAMLQVTTMELKCATTTCCRTRVGNAILGILPS